MTTYHKRAPGTMTGVPSKNLSKSLFNKYKKTANKDWKHHVKHRGPLEAFADFLTNKKGRFMGKRSAIYMKASGQAK
tara:strand:- start:3620 stop:3850 length:231 start_codon:yes stop_codon:yes gene_type:complete